MQTDMDGEVVYLRLHGKMAELLTEIFPDTYQWYLYTVKQTEPVLEVAQETIWGYKGSVLILEAYNSNTTQMRAHDQSMRFVCCKQRDDWISVHYSMGC